ncbi:hypothetical protein CDL15_Pgr021623 [Punica granatum]|uniref:Uncharacterized protein n=1 Tax=Punica granatum TaxID=22663 RepID=A0A218WSH9_PUNGR|nr:hypothetical protein CDL15_Pgr021623 [Punica granatum]
MDLSDAVIFDSSRLKSVVLGRASLPLNCRLLRTELSLLILVDDAGKVLLRRILLIASLVLGWPRLKHWLESLQLAFNLAVAYQGFGAHYHGSTKCNQDVFIVKFGSPLGFRLEAELLLAMHGLCKGSHKAFAGVQWVQRCRIHFPCTYCKEDCGRVRARGRAQPSVRTEQEAQHQAHRWHAGKAEDQA